LPSLITDLQEGGYRLLVRQQCPHGFVATGKAPQDVEEQDVLRDRVPKVVKGISGALHLSVELDHGQVTLLKGA
jgi:hypothetical protein